MKSSLSINEEVSLSIIFILINEQCLFYDDKKKIYKLEKIYHIERN